MQLAPDQLAERKRDRLHRARSVVGLGSDFRLSDANRVSSSAVLPLLHVRQLVADSELDQRWEVTDIKLLH